MRCADCGKPATLKVRRSYRDDPDRVTFHCRACFRERWPSPSPSVNFTWRTI